MTSTKGGLAQVSALDAEVDARAAYAKGKGQTLGRAQLQAASV